jgi:DNA-binding MarR family transcriptional regulator
MSIELMSYTSRRFRFFYDPRRSRSGPRLANNDEGDARPAAAGIEETGLGLSDFGVLAALLHKGPLPVNTIGPIVDLTSGSISIAVDRLVAKGLVSLVESAEDRRVRIVALIPRGKDLLASAFFESIPRR